jgi:protein phosphatase PTC7
MSRLVARRRLQGALRPRYAHCYSSSRPFNKSSSISSLAFSTQIPLLHFRQLSSSSSLKNSEPSDSFSPPRAYPRHPYTFHIATSYAGKPPVGDERAPQNLPFPMESPIGRWREEMLNRTIGPKKKRRGKDWALDAGEDSFYVQEVSEQLPLLCDHLFKRLDAKRIGRYAFAYQSSLPTFVFLSSHY